MSNEFKHLALCVTRNVSFLFDISKEMMKVMEKMFAIYFDRIFFYFLGQARFLFSHFLVNLRTR